MKELVKPEFYQNTFLLLFSIGAFLIIFAKLWFNKRFSLNISRPNVYIFEFESRAKYVLSTYNLNTGLFKIITYTLYIITIIKIAQISLNLSFNNKPGWYVILISTTGYFILKFLFEIIYIFSIKKSNFLSKIRFIRITYENYTYFYLFIIVFLIFFFPYQSKLFFYLIASISIIWILAAWGNSYISLRKHTELKTYQIILYLCLSEILPFLLLNGWIIFQIL